MRIVSSSLFNSSSRTVKSLKSEPILLYSSAAVSASRLFPVISSSNWSNFLMTSPQPPLAKAACNDCTVLSTMVFKNASPGSPLNMAAVNELCSALVRRRGVIALTRSPSKLLTASTVIAPRASIAFISFSSTSPNEIFCIAASLNVSVIAFGTLSKIVSPTRFFMSDIKLSALSAASPDTLNIFGLSSPAKVTNLLILFFIELLTGASTSAFSS